MTVELKPHQAEAVEDLDNGKILRGDPGTGKSFTALAYFYEKECGGKLNDWGSIKTPKDLYIITTAKKRDSGDWQRDAYKMGLMEDPTISVAGIKVTVDSWNNIEKYLGVKDAFWVFDEQKVVGSGLWAKTFVKIAKHNRWILLSATPGDTWMDYIPVFVANGFYKNITEFKQTHVVYSPWHKFPKVERYNGVGRLVRNRDAVLVEMPYERHTTRHLEAVVVAHNEIELEKVTKKRWNVYENRPLRDVAELFAVSRKVVNSDYRRLDKIRELQKKHKRLIVFYNFDYELDLLRTLGGPKSDASTISGKSETADVPMVSPATSTTRPHLSLVEPTSTTNDSPKTSKPLSIMSSRVEHSVPSEDETDTPEKSDGTKNDAWEYLLSSQGSKANESLVEPSMNGHSPKTAQRVRTVFKEIPSGESPTHRPDSLKDPTTQSSTQRRLYDRPSTSTLSASTHERVTRLLSGPTFSLDELTQMGSKLPALEVISLPKSTNVTDASSSSTRKSTQTADSPGPDGPMPTSVTIAEWNGHKHQPVPETDEWIYLVQYMAGSEAWNCTDTDAMAFYSMTYSYKQFEQAQGRIDRMNTSYDDLWYYVLYSKSWIDTAIKKALDMKQDFNEKRFRVVKSAVDFFREEQDAA